METKIANTTSNSLFPKPVDEMIGECVASVNTALITQLKAADSVANWKGGASSMVAINYMFGHPKEIIQRLKEMTDTKTFKPLRFPIVMLFADIQSSPSSVKGLSQDVTLNMVIAMSTLPTYKTADRITHSFEPVLRPIYQSLIQQIAKCGYFWVQSTRQILGHDIERLYWGSQPTDANVFNDYLDAIEIKGLKLSLTGKNAKTAANFNTVWRTVVLNIVPSPARPAVTYPLDPNVFIQVGGGNVMYKQYAPGNTITPFCVGDSAGYLAGKMIELPWFYSDTPDSLIDYDTVAGTWDNSANGGFSVNAYLTIKFLDNA